MKQLLIGTPKLFTPTSQNIIEHVNGKDNGNILLKHVLVITAGEENGNARVYPINLWQREVEKFTQKIKNRTSDTLGELDHPETAIINLRNASHAIRSMVWEGNNVYSDIEVFCDAGPKGNECGRILGSYLRNGLAVGWSSRGEGSLEQKGEISEVQDDFCFVTIDAVSNPSNAGSWSRLNEHKNNQKINPYNKIQIIITDILCNNGTCPIW